MSRDDGEPCEREIAILRSRRYLFDDSLRRDIVDAEVPVETDGGQKRKRRMEAHGTHAARVAFEVANDRKICERSIND
jgi:hypothetical protein